MKGESFFNSLWFSAILSVVAVWMLVDNAINQKYGLVVIWLLIACYFIKATYDKRK